MSQNLVRLPKVLEQTGHGRSTVYALIKAGEFPKQIATGARSVAWLQTEVDQWVQRQIEKSRPEDPNPNYVKGE